MNSLSSCLMWAALLPFRRVPLKCLNAMAFISGMVRALRSPSFLVSLETAAGAASMSLAVSSDIRAALVSECSLEMAASDLVSPSWLTKRWMRSGSLAKPDSPLM